jgi:nicotinate-nucleotide pyrophosphorylase (carboxylating)
VATATATFVKLIAHTRGRVCCTRKTTPGLRSLQKICSPLRRRLQSPLRLDDAILIKDNHIAIAGGIAPVLKRAKRLRVTW